MKNSKTMSNNETLIVFKRFSHIAVKKSKRNETIRRVRKGEKYEFWLEGILTQPKYPEEDVTRVKRVPFMGKRCECVAKEDRWYSGDDTWCRDIREVEEDWNGHVVYRENEDAWYIRPWIEIVMVDGEKYRTYYSTDDELEKALKEIFNEEVHIISADY